MPIDLIDRITQKNAGNFDLARAEDVRFGAGGTITLNANGVMTGITQFHHQADAASGSADDLDGVVSARDGRLLLISPAGGDTITVRHGQIPAGGQGIQTADGRSVVLSAGTHSILLQYLSGAALWIERARSIGWSIPTRSIILKAQTLDKTTTAGATDTGKVEIAAQRDFYFMDFPDGSKVYAFCDVVMPDNYDGGTFTARFHWTVNSTSTNGVRWGIQAVGYNDGTLLSTALGTAQEVTDNGLGTANVETTSAATPAATAAGSPAGGRKMKFVVYRDPANAADTMAATVRLMEVHIEYSTNVYSD